MTPIVIEQNYGIIIEILSKNSVRITVQSEYLGTDEPETTELYYDPDKHLVCMNETPNHPFTCESHEMYVKFVVTVLETLRIQNNISQKVFFILADNKYIPYNENTFNERIYAS